MPAKVIERNGLTWFPQRHIYCRFTSYSVI